MQSSGTTTIASGQKGLEQLLAHIKEKQVDLNEAETRFQIINRFIVECLGWQSDLYAFRLEQSQGRSYSDYELGHPRVAIWEAKREGRTFELPANYKSTTLQDLPSLLALGGETEEAIRQVQEYCSKRGVEVAVATNGHQLIAFLGSRSDGIAPLDGKCFVVNGYDQMLSEFPQIWQLLSPDGVAENRLRRFVSVGYESALPQKMSSYLINYPHYRYPSPLNLSLREISEFLLQDLIEREEVEKEFYEKCYCESGALSQHALISKQMLEARYQALFSPSEESPVTQPVTTSGSRQVFTPEVLAEAISQRPIVLLGDVGVGKTSFLKHLSYVSAFDEFRKALYLYIDLGSKGALSADLNIFVLNEIERQLNDKYNIDIMEAHFVRGVYFGEVEKFDRGIYGSQKEKNPQLYEQKYLELLENKIGQKDQHLRASIAHIASAQRKQVIIILDNADQREYEIQERAFVIAQNLSKDWHAAVFITLWPQTFHRSKQSGALTAYPHRVFTIAPPRVDLVIERRLTFALNMAQGQISVESLKKINLSLGSIALFLRALLGSLEKNEQLVEFLSNITGGNIRSAIELVTKFIGSANVDSGKIIETMEREGRYVVPVHEFWKAALLGEYSYYDPTSSLSLNLFDISSANPHEHFLLPMLLGFMDHDGGHKSKEGFVTTDAILSEMQTWGFTPALTTHALRRANNRKLIETSQRTTFNEDDAGLHGDMPSGFRISTIGAYHLKRWVAEFAYLDAMSYDTPIFDEINATIIKRKIQSFHIADRYARASAFRDYLSNIWLGSKLNPIYFDWPSAAKCAQSSFDRVQNAIRKIEAQGVSREVA